MGSFVLLVTSYGVRNPLSVNEVFLSVLCGSVVSLIGFLIDFAGQLDQLRESQVESFAKVSLATELYTQVEKSPTDTKHLIDLMRSASRIGVASELLQGLARRETRRLGDFLADVSTGKEFVYDGEDREWLFGLTEHATTSIDAISLSTVDAGLTSFDGGLWSTDLGYRYLRKQEEAISKRNVRIRRIFFFDDPRVPQDDHFRQVCDLQRRLGVETRILDETVPYHLRSLIFDFIVFDGLLSYETTPARRLATGSPPAVVTTHIIPEPARVRERMMHFDQLWAEARLPTWPPHSDVLDVDRVARVSGSERNGVVDSEVLRQAGSVDPGPTNA